MNSEHQKKSTCLGNVMLLILLTVISLSPQAESFSLIQQAHKEIRLYGYTRANRNMILSAEISAKIMQINYDVGEHIVKKPFIEMDTTFIKFEIKKTKVSIKKLDINVLQIQSKITFLGKEYRRIKLLNTEGKAAEKQLDEALQQLDHARFELRQTLQQQKSLQLTLAELQERKSRYLILAPDGWVVTERKVEVGEYIQPGHPLARLSDYQKLVVPLAVSSSELAVIKQLPAIFKARLENQSVDSRLRWVNPEFNEDTRKLNIKLDIINPLSEQRGGLRFELPLQIKTEGLLITKSAVSNRYENPRVTIVSTGESIPLLILGETTDHFIVAEDQRLKVGIKILIRTTK